MFERVPDCCARAIQHLEETRVSGHIGPKHKRIDEQADEIFRFDLIAPGDLRADRNVGRAGVAMQQRHQGGVGQHEQRATIVAGDCCEPVSEVAVQQLGPNRAGRLMHRLVREIGGQFEELEPV